MHQTAFGQRLPRPNWQVAPRTEMPLIKIEKNATFGGKEVNVPEVPHALFSTKLLPEAFSNLHTNLLLAKDTPQTELAEEVTTPFSTLSTSCSERFQLPRPYLLHLENFSS